MISINFLRSKNRTLVFLNLLLLIVGFSIPFSYAFNSISIGALFLYSFIWFKKSNYAFLLKKGFQVHILFLIYFLIQVLGVFYSEDINLAIKYLAQNVVFLLMPITFINLVRVLDYDKVKLGVYGFISSIMIILLSIHVNVFVQIVSQKLDIHTLFIFFVREDFVQQGLVHIHPPYFGLMVVFSLVGVIKTTFSKNSIFNAVIKYVLAAYLIISLYGISSFMSIILVFLLLVIYVFNLIRDKKIRVLVSIIFPFFLITLLAVFVINSSLVNKLPGQSLIGRIEWSLVKGKGDTSRPENWRSVVSVVKEHPLLGVGTYGGLDYLQKYRRTTSESYINGHNAHNQYLETLLRHGIMGLTIYFLMIYKISSIAIRSRDILFCAFIFTFSVASLTESYLMRQIGLTFFIFYTLLFSTFYTFEAGKKALK